MSSDANGNNASDDLGDKQVRSERPRAAESTVGLPTHGLPVSVLADRGTILGGIGYVLHGAVTGLAPGRLVIGVLLAACLLLGGWVFDRIDLAVGGAPIPVANASTRSENPLLEAQRFARSSAASFVSGTAFAAQVTPDASLSDLRAAVDGAGRERLASLDATATGDTSQRRQAVLVQWDRTYAAIVRATPRGPATSLAEGWSDAARRLVAGAVTLAPGEVAGAVTDTVVRVPGAALRASLVPSALWLLIAVLFVALFLGALSRMSAVEATRGEKIPLVLALSWLGRGWRRLVGVPLVTVGMTTGLSLLVLLVGVLLRVPGLDLIAALLYVVALGAATLAVVGAVAALLGLPFSLASVACGDADSLDATVRSAAYLFRHPVRTLGLAFTALVGVGAGTLVVGTLVAVVLAWTAWAVGLVGGQGAATAAGAPSLLSAVVGPEGQPFGVMSGRLAGVTARPAAAAIDLWEALLATLVIAYVFSAIAETFTRAYVLLRLACDGEDLSSIDGVPLGRPATPPASA